LLPHIKGNTYDKSYFGTIIIGKVGLRVKNKWPPTGEGKIEG